MGYFSYHNTAKRLIKENKLLAFYYVERHNTISPALVLVFNDQKHPVMPIRKERWAEYLNLLLEYSSKELKGEKELQNKE